MRDRDLNKEFFLHNSRLNISETYIAEIVPLGQCVETTLTNIHNPMDSLLRIGGLDIILINRINESKTNNS